MIPSVGADLSSVVSDVPIVGASMIGRCDTCPRLLCMVPGFGADVPSVGALVEKDVVTIHTVHAIDPGELANIKAFLA